MFFGRSVLVFTVSGATDYQTDHSLQMVDHVVNGNVHDDKTVDYYEPVHHVTSADVQATPPKRRGCSLHFNSLLS